jgi:hypothetical protein
MDKEALRRTVSQRDAEIKRLQTALREAKENMENDDEAGRYCPQLISINSGTR